MTTEKRSSKGGFLHLFDWNAKSRKKLFNNGSNQGRELAYDSETSQKEIYANGDGLITKGNGTCSSVSSISGDDTYGSRAPGVVAKLMGLESLPMSNDCEQSSVSFIETQNPRGDSDYARNGTCIPSRHYLVDYSGMSRGVDGFSWNSRDSRQNKGNCRPIERFQAEVLPPKTAKPISITHHKLLSPIKSPGFVPTNDATYIMEAAVRIIDSNEPPTSIIRNSSFQSSSAPMRIRDLKHKSEALHTSSWTHDLSNRSQQPSSRKQMRVNMQERSKKATVFEPSLGLEMRNVGNSTNKEKFISPGVHDTRNLQNLPGIEGSALYSTRSFAEKKYKQAKLKQYASDRTSQKRSGPMRSDANRSSGVLLQNNVKQNSITHRDRSSSKASNSSQVCRKAASSSSAGPSKLINKDVVNFENGSRKNLSATSVNGIRKAQQKPTLVKLKNISRNVDFVSKSILSDETAFDQVFSCRSERDGEHSRSLQNSAEVRSNMDVISFTFTSPIKRSGSASQSYLEYAENSGDFGIGSLNLINQHESKGLSSRLKLNFVSGDSLSLLLEQKLKELTDRVELVQSDTITEETDIDSSSCLLNSTSEVNSPEETSAEKNSQSLNEDLIRKDSEAIIEADCGCSDKDEESGHLNETYDLAFITDYSNSRESCFSSNSIAYRNYGNDHASSLGSHQVSGSQSVENLHQVVQELNFSDTAVSSCIKGCGGQNTTAEIISNDFAKSSRWEFDYVQQIIRLVPLEEFRLDENIEIIAADVFVQLEHLILLTERDSEWNSKLVRKLLFDCVNESISLRCSGSCFGRYSVWANWDTCIQKGDVLATELCKEFARLKSMGSLVLDELVDKDMSTRNGRWLDFELEMLEEGVEIVSGIEISLIEELIIDISFS
ncbi:hypothetical protein Drorol1_Dr00024954 [Drosera rotundifolia]